MGFALKPSCWNKWHSVATAARSMSCTKTQTTSGTNSASDQLYGHSFDPTALTEEHWLLIMRRRGLSGRKKVRINCQALPYWAPPYRALDHCLQSHRQEREEQLVAKLLGCSQPAKKKHCISWLFILHLRILESVFSVLACKRIEFFCKPTSSSPPFFPRLRLRDGIQKLYWSL